MPFYTISGIYDLACPVVVAVVVVVYLVVL